MKLQLKRHHLWFVPCILSFTLACGAVGLLWGYEPMRMFHCGLGGLDADWVHAYYPGSLINAATFGANGEVDLFDWKLAEIKARLALVTGSWLLVAAMLWLLDWRSRRSEALRIESWKPCSKGRA